MSPGESDKAILMKRRSPWNLYNCLWVANYASIGLAAVAGASLKLDASHVLEEVKPYLLWTHRWTWAIVPGLTFLGLLAKSLRTAIGPPWVWRAVQSLLEEYRETVFDMEGAEGKHLYRVTLFRHVTWRALFYPRYWHTTWAWGWDRWPWTGWLVPVARSGHTTQKSKAIFLAPDDAENSEGIAGRVWAGENVVVVQVLPDVNNDRTDENIHLYAQRTGVSEEWVRRKLKKTGKLSLSICGIPVEIDGDPWGVIVLDSKMPRSIKDSCHAWDSYRKLVPVCLAKFLSRKG